MKMPAVRDSASSLIYVMLLRAVVFVFSQVIFPIFLNFIFSVLGTFACLNHRAVSIDETYQRSSNDTMRFDSIVLDEVVTKHFCNTRKSPWLRHLLCINRGIY